MIVQCASLWNSLSLFFYLGTYQYAIEIVLTEQLVEFNWNLIDLNY